MANCQHPHDRERTQSGGVTSSWRRSLPPSTAPCPKTTTKPTTRDNGQRSWASNSDGPAGDGSTNRPHSPGFGCSEVVVSLTHLQHLVPTFAAVTHVTPGSGCADSPVTDAAPLPRSTKTDAHSAYESSDHRKGNIHSVCPSQRVCSDTVNDALGTRSQPVISCSTHDATAMTGKSTLRHQRHDRTLPLSIHAQNRTRDRPERSHHGR